MIYQIDLIVFVHIGAFLFLFYDYFFDVFHMPVDLLLHQFSKKCEFFIEFCLSWDIIFNISYSLIKGSLDNTVQLISVVLFGLDIIFKFFKAIFLIFLSIQNTFGVLNFNRNRCALLFNLALSIDSFHLFVTHQRFPSTLDYHFIAISQAHKNFVVLF